jgi:hypothetical protein
MHSQDNSGIAAALKPVTTDQLVTTWFDALSRRNDGATDDTNTRFVVWLRPIAMKRCGDAFSLHLGSVAEPL